MKVVNLNLAKHPINWLIIWSMAFLLFFTAHLIQSHIAGKHPADTSSAGPGTSDTPEVGTSSASA